VSSPATVLEGLGVAIPPRVVTNEDFARYLDTSDHWIRTRTGIAQRHIAEPGCATSDLATEAGARAIKSAGGVPVDAVILGTTSPDRPCPATAPEVATRLGLHGVAAFDVMAACSSFLYGLATAAGMVSAGLADRVLVIGAETMSRLCDPSDRGTVVLFGDGAGAAVLRRGTSDEPGALRAFDLGSDGEYADTLAVEAGGSRLPVSTPGVPESARYLRMDGREVYRQAVRNMVSSSLKVLDRSGWGIDDVDCLVGHQANIRILSAVSERLGIPPERCHVNVERYGNTSSASIPLALADANLKPGMRVLLTAFGAGFTWASTTLIWPDLQIG
jgi:3-oxoacyl-[acyl-carrier-protein] synthase-3